MATAPAHPPITDYQDVWVHHEGVALAKNATGFLTVLKTDATTMIAAGDAVDPYTQELPYIGKKPAPVVVTFTAFTAANPSVATASSADTAKLKVGDRVKMAQTGGTTLPALDTVTGTVASKTTTKVTFTGIDLTGADITGVTATGTVQ